MPGIKIMGLLATSVNIPKPLSRFRLTRGLSVWGRHLLEHGPLDHFHDLFRTCPVMLIPVNKARQ